jgi:CopG family transcriptional regulator / antitoxin EndoAI
MQSLPQVKKQQVGLRLPKYMIDEIDELTKQFSLNRTDIVIEALKSYLADQKAKMVYESFDMSCRELTSIFQGDLPETTLKDFIDEIETGNNS